MKRPIPSCSSPGTVRSSRWVAERTLCWVVPTVWTSIDVWGIVIKTRLACLRLDDMKEFYSEEDLNEEGNQRR